MKSKYKKALIVPYFGKFNNYFPLWLKSCEYNNDYDEEEIVLYPIKLEVIEPIKNQILDLR